MRKKKFGQKKIHGKRKIRSGKLRTRRGPGLARGGFHDRLNASFSAQSFEAPCLYDDALLPASDSTS